MKWLEWDIPAICGHAVHAAQKSRNQLVLTIIHGPEEAWVIYRNSCMIGVNNNFWLRVRWFGNDFYEWRSQEWKSWLYRFTSDKTIVIHYAGNSLGPPTAVRRLSGGPLAPAPIREYNGLRGEDRGPFNGQRASASNPVMHANPLGVKRYSVRYYHDAIHISIQVSWYDCDTLHIIYAIFEYIYIFLTATLG